MAKCTDCGADAKDHGPGDPICLFVQLAAANAEIERLREEVEDARIYITTDDGSRLHIRNLLRCGMRSVERKRSTFWANVADAFGVGSTSAHQLCGFVLLDPDTGQRTEDHPHA